MLITPTKNNMTDPRIISLLTSEVTLRHVHKKTLSLSVSLEDIDPPSMEEDEGFMVEVSLPKGVGYSSFPGKLTPEKVKLAIHEATQNAEFMKEHSVFKKRILSSSKTHHSVSSHKDFKKFLDLDEGILFLKGIQKDLKGPQTEFYRSALVYEDIQTHIISQSKEILQTHQLSHFYLETMTKGAHGPCSRSLDKSIFGYPESILKVSWKDICKELVSESHQLKDAPVCPNDTLDLLLAPDQLTLQIHESIGHPLEMDRILGDEWNYAGTSFVSLEDFGTLQYGSPLLNVTFDPTDQHQLASYQFDDLGYEAKKEILIGQGKLFCGLGGLDSYSRLQDEKRSDRFKALANARASSWNRAPIDRMANINMEPGTDGSFDDLVSKIEKGIFMKSNRSWSIDDHRDNFQFGCEWAQKIENGKLTQIYQRPNYRGRTLDFWRSLKYAGSHSIDQGYKNCGKGEPNQVMFVSHKAPYAVFENIKVFSNV